MIPSYLVFIWKLIVVIFLQLKLFQKDTQLEGREAEYIGTFISISVSQSGCGTLAKCLAQNKAVAFSWHRKKKVGFTEEYPW